MKLPHKTPYKISIELESGEVRKGILDLGKDEAKARRICEVRQKIHSVRTVALMDADWHLIDVYDGEWNSDIHDTIYGEDDRDDS